MSNHCLSYCYRYRGIIKFQIIALCNEIIYHHSRFKSIIKASINELKNHCHIKEASVVLSNNKSFPWICTIFYPSRLKGIVEISNHCRKNVNRIILCGSLRLTPVPCTFWYTSGLWSLILFYPKNLKWWKNNGEQRSNAKALLFPSQSLWPYTQAMLSITTPFITLHHPAEQGMNTDW